MVSSLRVGIPGMLAILGALLAACAGYGGSSPTPDTPPAAPPKPNSDLTVSVSDGSGGTTTWRLTCDPDGGTHPDPAAACRALDQAADEALPAVAADAVCAQVVAGPETATVSGTWRGKPVNSQLSRNNSCEAARWEALAAVLRG